jgi:hypothetical protein
MAAILPAVLAVLLGAFLVYGEEKTDNRHPMHAGAPWFRFSRR